MGYIVVGKFFIDSMIKYIVLQGRESLSHFNEECLTLTGLASLNLSIFRVNNFYYVINGSDNKLFQLQITEKSTEITVQKGS